MSTHQVIRGEVGENGPANCGTPPFLDQRRAVNALPCPQLSRGLAPSSILLCFHTTRTAYDNALQPERTPSPAALRRTLITAATNGHIRHGMRLADPVSASVLLLQCLNQAAQRLASRWIVIDPVATPN